MLDKHTYQQLIQFPTPFYWYDMALLKKTIDTIKTEAGKYNFHIHYALKANCNIEIIKPICAAGFGADCVSGNEVKFALQNNFEAQQIVFAGVGKNDDEINYALENNIFCFNCESLEEIEIINQLASKLNKVATIALRINPNVNANTHKYITTGLEENKFGISISQLPAVCDTLINLKYIHLAGLHFHIGSQITDLSSFKTLCNRVNEMQRWFNQRGIELKIINVGGGLGIDYHQPDEKPIAEFSEYFKLFNKFLELQPTQQVHFELGRSVVAQCGNLITRVLYVKKGLNTNFAICDAGMTELIRPALYQSYHKIQNLSALHRGENHLDNYDVVGPVCESSDYFGKRIELPKTMRGDILAIRSAGAYGEVMASNYNLRDKVKSYFSSSNLVMS
jgi:diaminopimelate decarboxylase